MCSEVTVKVWGIHVVCSEEEKERLRWKGLGEKEGFKPGMKAFTVTPGKTSSICMVIGEPL